MKADGTIAASYEYSPYGELLRCQGSYAASNPFRWSTKWTDEETNLVYYGHRYYSSRLGRFINRDPISESGGLNIYGFCGNNPVNKWDLLGMAFRADGSSVSLEEALNQSYDLWMAPDGFQHWLGNFSRGAFTWDVFEVDGKYYSHMCLDVTEDIMQAQAAQSQAYHDAARAAANAATEYAYATMVAHEQQKAQEKAEAKAKAAMDAKIAAGPFNVSLSLNNKAPATGSLALQEGSSKFGSGEIAAALAGWGSTVYHPIGDGTPSFIGADPYSGITSNRGAILGISYANHPVAAGFDHSKIIITPTDQSRYANDARFLNVDTNGNRYATIGAGPDKGLLGGLWAGVNRPRDVSELNNNRQPIAVPSRYLNENAAIEALFTLAENFNKNPVRAYPDYAFFPSGGTAYNSNSFVPGLLNAGGFSYPSPPGGRLPGAEHPVPAWYFEAVKGTKP